MNDLPSDRPVLLDEGGGFANEPPAPVTAAPFPEPSPTVFRQAWEDWTGAILSPTVFFRRARGRTSLWSAFGFAIAMSVLGHVVSLPASLLRAEETVRQIEENVFEHWPSLQDQLGTEMAQSWILRWPYLWHAGNILLAPILVPLAIFGFALCFVHPVGRMLGGRATLRQSTLTLSYASAAAPLLALTVIPVLGWLLYMAYYARLAVVAVRETQQITTGRAILALLIGGFILPGLLVGISIALIVLSFMMLMPFEPLLQAA
ncbi:MAG: YIP1 family protein [Nitrospirae bacterium]|nr:YIP1 family protein [Nitrospirota bacterium]